MKVWWLPILTRGKLHVEILPDDFPGENETGAALAFKKVPGALAARFPEDTKPKVRRPT